MVDTYTKVVLTIIALALVWIGIQPIIGPTVVRAASDTVRIDGIVKVEAWSVYGLKVDCISGCK